VRYGTLPNTYTDIHTNTLTPIISLLHDKCERLIVYANTGSGNLVVKDIGSACCLLFLIIAGPQDFSIDAFQSLRMSLCVQTHKYTFIHTLGRVCIPANSTIVSLAFDSQIAQIHISMQTHACLHTVLSRQIIFVCDNILHLVIDLDLHYSFFVTNMVQHFVLNVCGYRSRCSFLSLK